ncbi:MULTISPECIES: tyrosine-type recombinase/integrase [unclassified Caballeronia]|uniref:tyrosine-type recombinase/integrase n=1 Tax=unclassified Caballeronia TaxID=2646786 RepID=UPI0028604019|nr:MULTISPECIES: tyrosine-type recombinase/integrase [unclassified Caballeronia]MDR5777716.1 tyrosine-type recombinase/integrase [Caballeronia sp. LZ002]MDR5798882.1 tyrosine-type recombinase/integrase [Caballeronia sp. LZ001]MDR5853155.1 tyrosine-type recombinase/integrase [Caballeronia sp. LZ003]
MKPSSAQAVDRTTTLADTDEGRSILDWTWPIAPVALSIYDKYTDTSYAIRADDETWTFSYKGHPETIVFATGEIGSLQRRFALLTSGRASPNTLHQTGRMLVQAWNTVSALLLTHPEKLRSAWDVHVTTRALAELNKKVLKLACKANVGHWSSRTLPLVSSMATRANASVARRTGLIEGRQMIVSAGLQADIVNVLDAAVTNTNLSSMHLEGAAALALIYQHGVRPVQVLCLNLEHVRFFMDASNELACVVSFHAAKQRDGRELEILRQVKPEWVPIVERLHASAVRSGRSRLFESSNSSTLWFRAKALCKLSNVVLGCTAPQLRHTGAQALADAGHSRKSIQQFLGHVRTHSARVYVRASLQQSALINSALGASRLYKTIHRIARKEYVTLEEMLTADEDQQIGGIVGETLVAGIGLCRAGQSQCSYNPVTSCYGCSKFMPSLDTVPHREAIEGMRQQVRVYLANGVQHENPAYRQLSRALSGAQHALDAIERLPTGKEK